MASLILLPTMRDLDLLLGTRLKVRLLRALAELRAPVSARQATRLARVSVKGTQTLDELSKLGILEKREGTAQHLYQWQSDHYLAAPLKALFAAEEAKLRQIADLLRERLRGFPVAVGAIFGSSVRGDTRPDSDFDVLLLVSDRAAAAGILDRLLDAAPGLAKQFGVHLSPILFEVAEWNARAKAADPFVLRAAREALPFTGDPALLEADG